MKVYIVYEWSADSEPDSGWIDKTKCVFALYKSLHDAEKSIEGKNTEMKGLWSNWYTIEERTVI